MIVRGTAEEINWIKNALRNNCEDCPYIEKCNESAASDTKEHGKVCHTCSEFLEEVIEFIVD